MQWSYAMLSCRACPCFLLFSHYSACPCNGPCNATVPVHAMMQRMQRSALDLKRDIRVSAWGDRNLEQGLLWVAVFASQAVRSSRISLAR